MGQNIGVFDSGLGGLSVYRDIKKILPGAKIIYLADRKNAPYGTKTKGKIRSLTVRAVHFLERKNCGLIVLACNTATTSGINYYRKKFPKISFVGVVPPVKPGALVSKSKKVVILSTRSTAESPYLKKLIGQFATNCQVFNFGCPELVAFVENGVIDGPEIKKSLRTYLAQPLKEGADVIVLGCTHFIFLKSLIEKVAGRKVKVVEPSKPVAKQTRRLYQKTQPKALKFVPGEDEFYTSGNAEKVSEAALKVLKRKIGFRNAD